MQDTSVSKFYNDRNFFFKDNSMISYLNFLHSVNTSSKIDSFIKKNIKEISRKEELLETAKTFLAMGRFHLLMSSYRKAIECYIRSLDGFEQYDDINGIIITTIELCHAYNFLSDFVQVGRLNMQLHEMIFQTEDPIARAVIRLNIAKHAILNRSEHGHVMGKMLDMEKDIVEICKVSGQAGCWYLYCMATMILGYLKLEIGQSISAIALFKITSQIIEAHDFPVHFTSYVYYLLPEAHWLEYKRSEEQLTWTQKDIRLKKIRQLCEAALNKTESCPYHYGNALRVRAKYFILKQHYGAAENLFMQSIHHCSKFGRGFELGISIYQYAYLLRRTGRHADAVEKLRKARCIFKAVGDSVYLGRIAKILNRQQDDPISGTANDQTGIPSDIIFICKKLSFIQDIDLLAAKVLENSLGLSGADRGVLFIRNEKGGMELACANEFNRMATEEEIRIICSISAVMHPFKLRIPIRIGAREIGICCLDALKSHKKFNGQVAGSVYLFFSLAAPLIENCRLNQLIKRRKENSSLTIGPSTEKKMSAALDYVKQNYRSAISRNELADMLHMNPDNLGRYFKQYTGCKLSDYINALRMEEVKRQLTESDDRIINIAFSVGFESLSTFNRVFKARFQTTPIKYRKSHLKK